MRPSSHMARQFSMETRLIWRTATRSPWNFSSTIRRRDMGSFTSSKPLQRAFSDRPNIDWNQNDEFFRFTRARFVSDEESEMQQRHVRFDMNELAWVATKAAGCKTCINIEKYPDGMYNKVFQMTMEDGTQVVAKVPNPNAGQAHFTTASEVATMDFMRTVLKTPVPKVLAWNSRAEATSVGAEYIIMEKLTGVPLRDLWSEMEIEDQASVIQQVVNHEKSWMSASFSHFGSLYYSKDLDGRQKGLTYTNEEGIKVTEPRFTIGPSVGRDCFDEGRFEISFSRGPWVTVEEYQLSIGEREAACIKAVERLPNSPMTLPGSYIPTKERKLATLDIYSKLIKYLLPTDKSIITSNIWHEDLHGENILINPQKPSEIIGIIDWQSVVLRPLFENALHPHFLKYKGPRVTDTIPPEYPDTEGLDEAAVEAADQLWNKMSLAAYYRGYVQVHNPAFYRALEFHETLAWALLIYARSMLIEGEAVYRHRVANELEKEWPTLPAVQALGNPPFPIHFSTEEIDEIEKDIEDTARGIDEMRAIKKFMGYLWPEQGMVDESLYDDVKNAFREAKEIALREFASTEDERRLLVEGWPFDD